MNDCLLHRKSTVAGVRATWGLGPAHNT